MKFSTVPSALLALACLLLPMPALVAQTGNADIVVTKATTKTIPIAITGFSREAQAILEFDLAVTGFEVRASNPQYTLTGAPGQGTIYRIQAATPACTIFWISYNFPLGGTPVASLRENCSGTAVNTPIPSVKVVGKTIVIDLPFTLIPKAVKLGTALTEVFAETKGHASTPASSPTVPTFDDTTTSPTAYKIGS